MKQLLSALLLVSLAACADTPYGFGKAGPNEFLIITYPPLTVPPNITLRPPRNAEALEQAKTSTRASALLFGLPRAAARNLSAGERALLQKMATAKADPNIRKLIADDRGLATINAQ